MILLPVRILADSGCDLPLHYLEENHVTLFPLKVLLNNQEYEDLITIESKTIFNAIRSGQVPKTSQVSPALPLKKHLRIWPLHNEEGIYIAFSSQLSGTYQTAVMMYEQVKEKYPDFNLTIIDSKCASLGCGLIVREAVRLVK